jgi:hypothetical protein
MTTTVETDLEKAEAAQRELFRLTDVVVKEVSIVDRPANLRPFLLMKAAGSQGAELEPDGMGNFRLKPAPAVAEKAAPVIEEPVPVPPPPVVKASVDPALFAAALAPIDASAVEKVGRKLASKREQAIRSAIELLVSVLDDATKSVAATVTANKSLTDRCATAEAALAALRGEYETLKAEHVTVVRAVSKARGTVQKSNALAGEGESDAGRVVWPSDLNCS